MVMRNPPVPTAFKVIPGNPGKRAIRPEPQPPLVVEPPIPPRILEGDALTEWHRVTTELMQMRVLSVLDLPPLAVYCQAFGRWMMAEEAVIRMGRNDPNTHGMMVKGPLGNPMQNPLVKIAEGAAADMMRYASEFGFTVVARSRIAGRDITTDAPPSKFAGLLAG